MTRDEIKENILHKVDEISPYNEPDEQVEFIMEGLLDDVANRYILALPGEMLIASTNLTATTKFLIPSFNIGVRAGTGKYSDMAIAYVPGDHLRFMGASCPYWNRNIYENDLYLFESGEFKRQFDIHTRAGIAKPKIFMVPSYVMPRIYQSGFYGERMFIISPYRANWNITDLYITYHIMIKAEDIIEYLLDGFFYFAASHVLTSMRQEEFAKIMMQKFTEFVLLKKGK
jgi:hypothetical protein